MEIQEAVRALAALAQTSRLAVFRTLVEAGPAGVAAGGIASRLDIAPATLSFHLKELARAGLVQSRQDGRFVYYSTDFAAMAALMAFLSENCCKGMPEQCFAAVESALVGCCAPPSRSTGASNCRPAASRSKRRSNA